MFEKLNTLIVGRIERKRQQDLPTVVAVSADQYGMSVTTRAAGSSIDTTTRIPWGNVSRAAAARLPNYAGDDMVLVIEHTAGVIELTPAITGFDALWIAMEQHLSHSKPRAQWQAELIAAEPGVAVSLLGADGGRSSAAPLTPDA